MEGVVKITPFQGLNYFFNFFVPTYKSLQKVYNIPMQVNIRNTVMSLEEEIVSFRIPTYTYKTIQLSCKLSCRTLAPLSLAQ